MALETKSFLAEPVSQNDEIKHSSSFKNDNKSELLVDYSKSASYHTEPLFVVNNEQIYGYENYKTMDQVQGHGIRQNPQFLDDTQNKEYYLVEEKGKKYSSGKTYYLGYQVAMIPTYHDKVQS